MREDRFFLIEENQTSIHSSGTTSLSCDCMPVVVRAVTAPEDLSKREWAELAEHVRTCSACTATLTEYQEVKTLIGTLTSQQLYKGEPKIQLSLMLIRLIEEAKEKENSERRNCLINSHSTDFGHTLSKIMKNLKKIEEELSLLLEVIRNFLSQTFRILRTKMWMKHEPQTLKRNLVLGIIQRFLPQTPLTLRRKDKKK